jgi:hypothetical protein
MSGYARIKRKVTGMKSQITDRFRKKAEDENPKERDGRPLLTSKKVCMSPWQEPEQLLCLNTKKSEKNQMCGFATSGSAVIATTFSDDTTSTNSSDLYRQRQHPTDGSRIVHPVVCKRDMYLGLDDVNNNVKKKKQARDPFGHRESLGNKEPDGNVCQSDHNKSESERKGGRERNPSLPSYSIAASMICAKQDESGKVMPSKKNPLSLIKSPPKTRVLPPNTILASMLFQSLEDEEPKKASHYKSMNEGVDSHAQPVSRMINEPEIEDDESDDEFDEDKPIPDAIGKDREYAASSVSSVTMYSSHHNDPVVRASNNLYNLLRANHAAVQRITNPRHEGLYEA